MNPIIPSIKSNQLVYVNSDKPVFTIIGVPNTLEYIEIYNQSENIVFSHNIELPSTGIVNYTLDISQYKPGLYSSIVSTSASKVSTNFRVSQVQLSGPIISFNPMNKTFVPGDSITILGSDGPNDIIHLSLINPNGNVINSVQVNSDSIGQFSSNDLKIPMNAIAGVWVINATHGIAQGIQKINVNSSQITALEIKSPLKQFKSGVPATKVVCNQGFQLIIKREDSSPACVKPDTVQKLIERVWAVNMTDNADNGTIKQTIDHKFPHPPDGFGCGMWSNATGWVKGNCVSPNIPHP